MRYYFHSNIESFSSGNQLPKHFSGKRIRNAKVSYGYSFEGEYVSQEGRFKGFSFSYDIFNIAVQSNLFRKRLSPCFEIVYLLKGNLAIAQSTQVMKNGCCYICYEPRGEIDYLLQEGHYSYFLLTFGVSYLGALSATIKKLATFMGEIQNAPGNFHLLFAGGITKTTRHLIETFCQNQQDGTERELILGAYARTLLSMISELLRKETLEIVAEVTEKALSAYIDQHLDSSLKISMIAKAFALNEAATKKLFRKLFNSSVHQYILERRLELARRLLLETQDSVYIISLRAGFWDASHFVKCFKAAYGITPFTYRKQHG